MSRVRSQTELLPFLRGLAEEVYPQVGLLLQAAVNHQEDGRDIAPVLRSIREQLWDGPVLAVQVAEQIEAKLYDRRVLLQDCAKLPVSDQLALIRCTVPIKELEAEDRYGGFGNRLAGWTRARS
jgi:hypothetical protein